MCFVNHVVGYSPLAHHTKPQRPDMRVRRSRVAEIDASRLSCALSLNLDLRDLRQAVNVRNKYGECVSVSLLPVSPAFQSVADWVWKRSSRIIVFAIF